MSSGCWPGWPEGLVSSEDVITDFVNMCNLTPEDTYMIDLLDFVGGDVANKTVEEIQNMLIDYRQARGDNLRFLEHNPASVEPISDFARLRWVHFSTWVSDDLTDTIPHGAVLVDMTQSIMWTRPGWSLLADQNGAMQTVMTVDQLSELATLLQATSAWSPQADYLPRDWVPSSYQGWQLVLCDQDYSIHRYDVSGLNQDAPPGFEDFAAAIFRFAELLD